MDTRYLELRGKLDYTKTSLEGDVKRAVSSPGL
jgi:hypothetical protein